MNHKGTKTRRDPTSRFKPIPENVERIATQVVDSAYAVHVELGPGLLESVYEECMVHELTERGLSVARQVPLPLSYKGH